jgi:hypothetical protein
MTYTHKWIYINFVHISLLQRAHGLSLRAPMHDRCLPSLPRPQPSFCHKWRTGRAAGSSLKLPELGFHSAPSQVYMPHFLSVTSIENTNSRCFFKKRLPTIPALTNILYTYIQSTRCKRTVLISPHLVRFFGSVFMRGKYHVRLSLDAPVGDRDAMTTHPWTMPYYRRNHFAHRPDIHRSRRAARIKTAPLVHRVHDTLCSNFHLVATKPLISQNTEKKEKENLLEIFLFDFAMGNMPESDRLHLTVRTPLWKFLASCPEARAETWDNLQYCQSPNPRRASHDRAPGSTTPSLPTTPSGPSDPRDEHVQYESISSEIARRWASEPAAVRLAYMTAERDLAEELEVEQLLMVCRISLHTGSVFLILLTGGIPTEPLQPMERAREQRRRWIMVHQPLRSLHKALLESGVLRWRFEDRDVVSQDEPRGGPVNVICQEKGKL